MKKIAMAIHGGAGPLSDYIKENENAYLEGIEDALKCGYTILANGGKAIDAVEAAVKNLEDNIIFNAGIGSALNSDKKVEMDASIMDGAKFRAGAVASVNNIKNPIGLARIVLDHTNHVLVTGQGLKDLAKEFKIPTISESYFIVDHQLDELEKSKSTDDDNDQLKKPSHGTVGAVALDEFGNLAAATSTGGTSNSLAGRIGDSCLIGSGCYANANCAVSGTGDGELLITNVTAHSVAILLEFTKKNIQTVCDTIIHERYNEIKGDIGIISISKDGDVGMSFNSDRMHRGWITAEGKQEIHIYREN